MNPSTPIVHNTSDVRLRFSMELLTDALPGAGSAPGETFDNTVRTDRFGLPYLPARTLKGLWLNAFREYADVMGEETLSQADLALLFGTPGTEGCLRFGNGLPEGAEPFETWLMQVPPTHRPDPTRVKEAFVTRRGQTRIDPFTGTAVPGTLRQAQYLRAGLVFTAEITLQLPPDPQAQVRLDALLQPDEAGRTLLQAVVESDALRRFGTNRNRGVGAIACRLETVGPGSVDTSENKALVQKTRPESARLPSTPTQPDGRRLRRILRLTNPERLSIADNQPNEVDCLSYLPGNLLLGAMAGAFRRAVPKSPEADMRFRRLFLDGTCRYANAHLCDSDGNRSLPAPIGFFRTKDRRLDDQGRLVLSMERSADFCKALGGFAVPVPGQDTRLREVRPLLVDALHVALPGNRVGGGASGSAGGKDAAVSSGSNADPSLYSMQSLEAGQTFASFVEGPADCLSQLEALFPNGSTLQVGRSRGAQYGSVKVEWGETEPCPCNATRHSADMPYEQRSCLLVLGSPWLPATRPDDGEPDFQIPNDRTALARDLAAALGVPRDAVQVEDTSVIRQAMTGGFHTFWGVPRPHQPAVAAGSTLVLRLPANIASTSRTLWLGRQCQEGFGEARLHPVDFTCLEPVGYKATTSDWPGMPWTQLTGDQRTSIRTTPFARVVISHVEDALRACAIRDGRQHAATCRITRSTTASRIRRFLAGRGPDASHPADANALPVGIDSGRGMRSRPAGVSPSFQTSGAATVPLPDVLRDFWAEVLQLQPKRGREFFFWFHRVPEGEDKMNWNLKQDTLYDRAMKRILERLDDQGFRPLAETPGQPSVSGKATSAPNAEQSPWKAFLDDMAPHFLSLYLDAFLHEVYRTANRGDA